MGIYIMGSKKASKKPTKKINKKSNKTSKKSSKKSSKKKKKSSKNKVEDSDEYMRRIIFSTEDDNVKTSKQQPSSIPSYTPTFNPQHQQKMNAQIQMNSGMVGQPIVQAPTL